MSVQAEGKVPASYLRPAEARRNGWTIFAGVLLLILGTLNVIDGIAAISSAHFFVTNARYLFADLNSWGWVILILGALQLLVGFGVLASNQAARWTGVGILGLNAIASC